MTYRFREARERAGLSTLEVAKRIGVSQPAVTNWDNGTKFPSIDTLCKLALPLRVVLSRPSCQWLATTTIASTL